MSQRLKQQDTIRIEKMSSVLGLMKYVESTTRTNAQTGEVKTTVTVLSDLQMDQYAVTVDGNPLKENPEFKDIQRGTPIDFIDCEYGHRAEVVNGWQNSKTAMVYEICAAKKMVPANASQNQQKPVNK